MTTPALFALGVHVVIEQLISNPTIRQIWFPDDGILHRKCHQVREALFIMSSELAKINWFRLKGGISRPRVHLHCRRARRSGRG